MSNPSLLLIVTNSNVTSLPVSSLINNSIDVSGQSIMFTQLSQRLDPQNIEIYVNIFLNLNIAPEKELNDYINTISNTTFIKPNENDYSDLDQVKTNYISNLKSIQKFMIMQPIKKYKNLDEALNTIDGLKMDIIGSNFDPQKYVTMFISKGIKSSDISSFINEMNDVIVKIKIINPSLLSDPNQTQMLTNLSYIASAIDKTQSVPSSQSTMYQYVPSSMYQSIPSAMYQSIPSDVSMYQSVPSDVSQNIISDTSIYQSIQSSQSIYSDVSMYQSIQSSQTITSSMYESVPSSQTITSSMYESIPSSQSVPSSMYESVPSSQTITSSVDLGFSSNSYESIFKNQTDLTKSSKLDSQIICDDTCKAGMDDRLIKEGFNSVKEGFDNVKIPNTQLINEQVLEEQNLADRLHMLLYVWVVIAVFVFYVFVICMLSENGWNPLANYVLVGILVFSFYYIYKNIV
jgi:hypothetical protein